MEIKIGKKEFKFIKVSIWIAEEYGKLTNMAYCYTDFKDEIAEIVDTYDEKIKTCEKDEKKFLEKKQIALLKDVRKRTQQLTTEIFMKRMEILQEMVELNGYDYDDNFWRRKATVEEINDIMVDGIGTGSKKKLTST